MRIKSIGATNFKGCTFNSHLFPVTVITGDNGEGKSAHVEALALAVLGYMPTERPDKPIKDSRLLFDLFSSGSPMRVGFDAEGTPCAREWREDGKSVRYTGPAGPVLPPHSFDYGSYLGLTGPERLRFMLQASGAGADLAPPKLVEAIKGKLAEIGQDPDLLGEGTEMASFNVSATVSATEWLKLTVEAFVARRQSYDATCRRLKQTQLGQAETAQQGLAPDPAAEAKLDAAQARRDDALKLSSAADETLRLAREEYATLLAESKKGDVQAAESAAVRIEQLTAQRRMITVPSYNPKEHGQTQVSEQSAKEMLRVAKQQANEAKTHLADAKKQDKCPTCGQAFEEHKRKTLKQLKEVATLADRNEAEAAALVEKCGKELAAIVKLKAEHDRAVETVTAIDLEIAECQKKIHASAAAAAAAAKLPALQQHGMDLAAKAAELKQRLNEAEAAVADAREPVRKLQAARGEAAARERAREEREKAEAGKKFFSEACDMLAQLQAELVQRAVGPIVEKVNLLAEGLLPSPAEFRDGELTLKGWTHRTASDSEKLALYAGLSFALAQASPVKLAIIPRFESFGPSRQDLLVERAVAMVRQGVIDQCVFVEVEGRVPASEAYARFASAPEFGVLRVSKGKSFHLSLSNHAITG
jgi:hypothetical protein